VGYFSQREYRTFLAEVIGQAKVRWLALSGKPLGEPEANELEQLIDQFFRNVGHRSFEQHWPTRR